MPCQKCLELEQEIQKLQELRFQQIKESDVFKVLYAQFSQVVLDMDRRLKEKDNADLQFSLSSGMHGKKNFDA